MGFQFHFPRELQHSGHKRGGSWVHPGQHMFRHRFGHGSTLTQNEKKNENATILAGQHNDMETMYVGIVLSNQPRPKGAYENQRIIVSATQLYSGDEGRQKVVVPFALMNYGQLTQPLPLQTNQSSNANFDLSWPVNPFDINPNEFIIGSKLNQNNVGLNSTGSPLPPISDRVWLDKIWGFATTTNFSNINTHCKLYWFVGKLNTARGPEGVWADCYDIERGQLNNVNYFQPTATTGVGQSFTPGPANNEILDETPFRFGTFNRYMKLVHVKGFTLKPGETIKHKFHVKVNKVLSREWLNELSKVANVYSVRGLTVMPMLVFYGAPVVVRSGDPANSPQTVTSGTTRIGFMVKYNVDVCPLPGSRNKYTYAQIKFVKDVGNQNVETLINDVDVAVTKVNI